MDTPLTHSAIGTRAAFKVLYDNCYETLIVYSVRLIHDRNSAEDIVQSVFVTLWERRDSFYTVGAARSFLFVSVRNRSIDFLQHKSVEGRYAKHVFASNELTENPDEDADVFTAEVYARLFKAIDELSQRQREIFILMMNGHKNRDIAKALGIAEDTVRVQKRRAMKSLRLKLGEAEMVLLHILIV